MRRHRPFDVIDVRTGWLIVSRTGRFRRWSPAMAPGLAKLRARMRDTREQTL